nr:MAG TPA: hypothetical protein [Crassvirales sp.]
MSGLWAYACALAGIPSGWQPPDGILRLVALPLAGDIPCRGFLPSVAPPSPSSRPLHCRCEASPRLYRLQGAAGTAG